MRFIDVMLLASIAIDLVYVIITLSIVKKKREVKNE